MDTVPAAARPLSPPQSIHGDANVAEEKASTIEAAPYTPPASYRPTPYHEPAYVSDLQYDDPSLPSLPPQGQYDDPSLYQLVPDQVHYQLQPTFVRAMPYHTPPAAPYDQPIHTRSGRYLGSPIMPQHPDTNRGSDSPVPKRKPKPRAKAKADGPPVIDEPLSVSTRDYRSPLKDMEAYVNRSSAVRQEEARNRKDKRIPRPMNSFMLYRSAFADRTKQFCRENNHQVVSKVTGASWPLEPKEVRDFYERLAVIERDNHALAHPDYKFAPNKDGKRKFVADGDDDESDPEWGVSTRSIKRPRAGKREDTRSLTSSPFGNERGGYVNSYHSSPALNPSSYQAVNPYGPPPITIGSNGLAQSMYPMVVPYGHRVDDIRYRPIEDPYQQYDMSSQLVGMPGSKNDNLMAGGNILVDPNMSYLDPRLGAETGGYQYAAYRPANEQTYDIPRSHAYQPAAPDATYGTSSHPGMATLTEGHDIWNDAGAAGSAFDQELSRWG